MRDAALPIHIEGAAERDAAPTSAKAKRHRLDVVQFESAVLGSSRHLRAFKGNAARPTEGRNLQARRGHHLMAISNKLA